MPYAPLIAPSILSADLAHLDRELDRIRGADWVHVDVMDGHFVPNLSFGAPVAAAVHRASALPMDCHLMIDDPIRWVGEYVDAGAHNVTFHVEAAPDPRAVIDLLHSRGCSAGVSLRPGTPVDWVAALLDTVDLVLLMSVEPGFGGQAFQPEALERARRLRTLIDAGGRAVHLQIDGGIGPETIGPAAAAGCDVFVAGSAVYGAADPGERIAELRRAATAAHG